MDHLFLTGFMASGKSAVGRQLAKRLQRRFVDLDAEIERAAGLSVAEIFARFGEPEFRARERRALEQASGGAPAVIATGGGIVVDAENRRRMRAHGTIVCLAATVEEILRRVGEGGTRPLLARATDAAERRARVERLLADRAAAYADADHTVDTSGRAIAEVVDEIVARIGARHAAAGPRS